MKATIRDTRALNAVSPVALAAYAQSEGWIKGEPYGDYSNVYAAHGLPEIILPLRYGNSATTPMLCPN